MDLADFETENREWKENAKGNYVCIEEKQIVATVFKNPYGVWQIVLKGEIWGRLVTDEIFTDPGDAIDRAMDVLDGADYQFIHMYPRKNSHQ